MTVVQQLVVRFCDELWNGWNDALVEDVLTPYFVFRGSLGTEMVGRQGWRDYRDCVRAAASDFHNEVVTMVVEDNKRLRVSGSLVLTPVRCPSSAVS